MVHFHTDISDVGIVALLWTDLMSLQLMSTQAMSTQLMSLV